MLCRNPTLAKCGGEAQHLEKVRIWSPPGLPNVQSSTARPKTPRIEVFLVSLERSWSVDIENGLALVIWTSVAQVMGKRRAGTTKSRESTSSRPPNWKWDTSLKRFRRGLQVWFRPRCDQTSQSGVMSSQSLGTPPGTVFGTISGLRPGSPGKKWHSGVGAAECHRVYYREYGGGILLSPGRGESSESKCPWLVPTPKGVPECELTMWVVCFDADSSLIY
jgi:hypothetical protein